MTPRKARRSGISHYLVAPGAGLAKGIELAKRIAGNAPMTNFAVTHVLPRIAESDPRQRLSHRGADRGDRPGRRRGEGAAQGVSGEARAEGRAQELTQRRAESNEPMAHAPVKERRPEAAGARCGRCGSARATSWSSAGRTAPSTSARRTRSRPIRRSSPSGWSTGPQTAPERIFMAQRDAAGGWRKLTYAQTLEQVRRIGAGAAATRSLARAADRDPVRQRHRARAARRSPPCMSAFPTRRSRRPIR